MAYDGTVSFSAGEQPSAAKWNKLPANDASFHDGTGIDNKVIVSRHLEDLLRRGWFNIHTATGTVETCTYVSADAPSFVFSVPGDRTADIWAGMRFTGTQATGGTKYFIITLVSFDAGNNRTLVTIYGGTDYTLTNQTITSPAFATCKAPVGFPLNPLKWSVVKVDLNNTAQGSPVDGTIYNAGSISQSIPIGAWKLSFSCCFRINGSSINKQGNVGISTAANTFYDADLKVWVLAADTSAYHAWPCTAEKTILLAAKQTFYLNYSAVNTAGGLTLAGTQQPNIIKAVCAYL